MPQILTRSRFAASFTGSIAATAMALGAMASASAQVAVPLAAWLSSTMNYGK